MPQQFDYRNVFRAFLPPSAELIELHQSNQPFFIQLADVDLDGSNEVLGAYRWQGETYILVLKRSWKDWQMVANLKGDGFYQNYFYLERKSVHLYPAPIQTVEGTKWGYINNQGEFILKPQYNLADDFQENGLAIVRLNQLYGIINESGMFIVKPIYQSITPFSEGRSAVIDDKGFKVIDETGKVVTTKSYSYIGTFEEDRALFANSNAEGNYLYGYLNRKGYEVIPLRYESASDFSNGKAVVKKQDGNYGLIRKNGELISTYKFAFVGNLGDGLLSFQETIGGKYGYIDEKGKVVIQPQFSVALPFHNGVAVVNTSEDLVNKYGLIDKKGTFTIQPLYNDLKDLGEGRFAVGKAIDEKEPFKGSKYAISDGKGTLLTDFLYTIVADYEKQMASVSDGQTTFFIDKSGKAIRNLPVVEGSGLLTIEDSLIKAMIDERLSYYSFNGELVWKHTVKIPLNSQYRVLERKFKPNKDFLVYYPQISGMESKRKQEEVNQHLKQLSNLKEIDPNIQLDYSYTGDFSIEFFKKQLLVLELNGYEYYFGAAHGMPSKVYPHVDLVSGQFYTLNDLFKSGSNYVEIISNIIEHQIKTKEEYSYVFPRSYKGIEADQPFYVSEDALYIYFAPYEIGPYAAGFPTFKIPYEEIMPIINQQGAFWISFH